MTFRCRADSRKSRSRKRCERKGIAATVPPPSEKVDFSAVAAAYTAENVVAEHVSPPLSEEIKVTLKVSQNLHATMTPFILGEALAHKTKDIDQAGFDLERAFLMKAGLDLSGASQGDGAGGAQSAYFTPDFMVHYLAFMSRQKDFSVFENALPVLGRDGTLWNIQVNSPAAGHVFAKTGTFDAYDNLNRRSDAYGQRARGLYDHARRDGGWRLRFTSIVFRFRRTIRTRHKKLSARRWAKLQPRSI